MESMPSQLTEEIKKDLQRGKLDEDKYRRYTLTMLLEVHEAMFEEQAGMLQRMHDMEERWKKYPPLLYLVFSWFERRPLLTIGLFILILVLINLWFVADWRQGILGIEELPNRLWWP